MYATLSCVIRGLTKEEYAMLAEMCRSSNSLHNVALYNVRQFFFANEKYLSYYANCDIAKHNENYKNLQAGVAQQILRNVDQNFKSFFALLKKAKAGEYSEPVHIPGYLEKGAQFNLILSSNNAIHIKKDEGKLYITLPMSRTFSEAHGNKKIRIRCPNILEGKTVKEVRICPVQKGRYYKIHYVYLREEEPKLLSPDIVMSIDLGVDNLCACLINTGTSFIMDGRKLKSIICYFCKQTAHYRSIADRQGLETTKRLDKLLFKRNNCTLDYLRKTARYIINRAIEAGVGTLVCGYSSNFKKKVNLGKVNNQQFTQISYGKLRSLLKGLCERYGIKYIEQEESYTSQASCLDNDDIPVYDPKQPFTGTFSGKRVHRGLYQFAEGKFANADINAAANILRKSKQPFDEKKLYNGLLDSPLRVRVS